MSDKSLMDTFFPNANLEAGPSTSAPATTVPPASSEPQGAANGNSARVLTNDVISTLLRGGRMPSAAAAWERRSESRSSSSHSNEGDDEESDDVNDNAQLSFDDGYEYSESSTVLDEMEADGEEVVYAADIRINGHSADRQGVCGRPVQRLLRPSRPQQLDLPYESSLLVLSCFLICIAARRVLACYLFPFLSALLHHTSFKL